MVLSTDRSSWKNGSTVGLAREKLKLVVNSEHRTTALKNNIGLHVFPNKFPKTCDCIYDEIGVVLAGSFLLI